MVFSIGITLNLYQYEFVLQLKIYLKEVRYRGFGEKMALILTISIIILHACNIIHIQYNYVL